MKTGIDMVKDGYALVNVPSIKSLITGKVYLYQRPQNSKKKDIVLNTLALTNEQLQQGVFNVNIHCPNLNLTIEGEADNTQPDITSLSDLTTKICAILNDYVGFDFKLYAVTTGIPIRDVDGEWYVNIRVNYTSFQNNYTNI